jgi:predicted HD phosphohydrolase
MQISYRARQFWGAVRAAPDAHQMSQAMRVLGPNLYPLFLAMQPSEQAHSLQIYTQLVDQGETDSDLLAAALLHDAGKSLHPLRAWERVTIVLGKAFFPKQARQWGLSMSDGWRRPFVVAEQHAAWGADLAARHGASPRLVWFIRRHQTGSSIELSSDPEFSTLDDKLLKQLQKLDNES